MQLDQNFLDIAFKDSTINSAQLTVLGHTSVSSLNWKDALLGKELSNEEANLIILLRGINEEQTQQLIIENYQLLKSFRAKPTPQSTDSKAQEGDIEIYCDGACMPNPGKAGSGVAVYGNAPLPDLYYGQYNPNGTNNTAELNALLFALELSKENIQKGYKATIFADSKYSIDCIITWAYGWKKKGWTKKGGEIKNLEVIKEAHNLYEEIKNDVEIKHVKGHAGHEGNELADRMAMLAVTQKNDDYLQYEYKSINSVLALKAG
jgi:ribonuclease HI